jgi:hypothetical protein
MFEPGSDPYAVCRVFDQPQPVLVDLAALWPPVRVRWGLETPLRVRNRGLQADRFAEGLLHEWWLTAFGDWVGWTTFQVVLDGRMRELAQPVPAAALRPALPDPA